MNMQERLAQRCNELEKRIAALETLEATMAHVFGWDGSAWRKLPLVWGYSDTLQERWNDADADAGANSHEFTAVPAGEIWVITNLNAADLDNVVTEINWIFVFGGTNYQITAKLSPAARENVGGMIHIVLEEGAVMKVSYIGVTLNDYIYGTIVGYKMKVSE